MQKQIIIPPEGGWEESTHYLVEVSFSETNPAHNAIFFTGFLNGVFQGKGKAPGAYNVIFNPAYEYQNPTMGDVYFMRAKRVLVSSEEWEWE